MKQHKAFAQAGLFLNTLIWGATFTIIKKALDDVSRMMFVSTRFLFASLIMLPFFAAALFKANAKQYKQATILGILMFIGYITQTIGLMTTTATKSAFITGTFVIFTPIFQTILEKRIPSVANILAIVLATIGVIFLSSKGLTLYAILRDIGSDFSFGDFLTLICAVSYALYIVYLDMISEGSMDYKFLTYWQVIVTAGLSVLSVGLLHWSSLEPVRLTISPLVISAILYTALLATILTTTIQTKFQKAVSPVRASLIFSMEPIFAAAFAFFILQESISLFKFIGSGLIISAVLLSEFLSQE